MAVVCVQTCPRCHRSFGGLFAYRKAHTRRGCRRPATLLKLGMYQRPDGVWSRWGPTTADELGVAVQLRLPLFGRGRPRKRPPLFSVRTRDGRTWRLSGQWARGRLREVSVVEEVAA